MQEMPSEGQLPDEVTQKNVWSDTWMTNLLAVSDEFTDAACTETAAPGNSFDRSSIAPRIGEEPVNASRDHSDTRLNFPASICFI